MDGSKPQAEVKENFLKIPQAEVFLFYFFLFSYFNEVGSTRQIFLRELT